MGKENALVIDIIECKLNYLYIVFYYRYTETMNTQNVKIEIITFYINYNKITITQKNG